MYKNVIQQWPNQTIAAPLKIIFRTTVLQHGSLVFNGWWIKVTSLYSLLEIRLREGLYLLLEIRLRMKYFMIKLTMVWGHSNGDQLFRTTNVRVNQDCIWGVGGQNKYMWSKRYLFRSDIICTLCIQPNKI